MAAPPMSMAAQPPVNLGTTSTFAILAGSEITNTGMTIISGSAGGDVGLSPGTAFTGQANVTTSGSVHIANAIAIEAKEDLITAYNDAAGRTPVTRISTELGGTTLTPGTYDSADGTFQITGTLTLDAQGDPDGVFVFKTASSLITASDSHVNLINGAQSCNIFWKVGSSATLGTNSHFVGHIFALASITANNGATVQGQLLARNGAVTLDNNVIINESCDVDPIPPAPAILHVIKHVINSNGGTAVAGNFNLHVKTSGNDVATSPQPGVEAPGTSYTLPVGNYIVSEDANLNLDPDKTIPSGYTFEDVKVPLDPSLVLPVAEKTVYPVYPVYPGEGDTIGSLTIPALQRELPILQGTGVAELKKGVGHFAQSVLPGEDDNCVFSGHRETVFRQLDALKIGDLLIVQTSAGTFTYKVNGTRIVHQDDKTVIVPTDHAVLTMTTCYPFNTPGYYPDRYIVTADLVKSKIIKS